MNYKAYSDAANRGNFKWEVIEYNDYGGVIVEECYNILYKGANASITKISDNEYEVEIDNLINKPNYILMTIPTRKLAKNLAERIINNDRNGDWRKNLKYIDEY